MLVTHRDYQGRPTSVTGTLAGLAAIEGACRELARPAETFVRACASRMNCAVKGSGLPRSSRAAALPAATALQASPHVWQRRRPPPWDGFRLDSLIAYCGNWRGLKRCWISPSPVTIG